MIFFYLLIPTKLQSIRLNTINHIKYNIMHHQKSPNTKLNTELTQIKSLLADIKKIRLKCKVLADGLGVSNLQEEKYKNLERSVTIKMELLDLTGLVALKNQLVKILTEMFDVERELLYKKQKQQSNKKSVEKINKRDVNKTVANLKSPDGKVMVESTKKLGSLIKVSEKKERSGSKQKEQLQGGGKSILSQIRRERAKPVQIPIYKSKVETNESKLDRISKYIASLKSKQIKLNLENIKTNAESTGQKWKLKEYLLEDQDYLACKQQLQRFQMREQEMHTIIDRIVCQQVKDYFNQASLNLTKINQEDGFRYVKIYKKKVQPKIDSVQIKNMQESLGTIQEIQKPSLTQEKVEEIEIMVKHDFEEIKLEVQRKNQEFNEMLSKISETVQRGNEKLLQIREKRKKMFEKDDEMWDEL